MAEPNIMGQGYGNSGSAPQPGAKFEIKGLRDTSDSLDDLTKNLKEFKHTMRDIGSNQGQLTQGLNSVLSQLQRGANQTNAALNGPLSGSLGSSTTPVGVPYGAMTVAGGGSAGKPPAFQTTLTNMFSSGSEKSDVTGLVETIINLTKLPIQYTYDRIEENRANSLGMAQLLGPSASLTGNSILGLLKTFSEEIPVRGGLNEMLGAVNVGAQTGYGNFDSARSGSYFTAVRQMQQMTPGIGADVIAQQYSAHLGNTQAQQRAMMLTGGAMSSFGPGGTPKTLQEWAEGLLKFFQNQRPGKDRGQTFKKEQLEVQMFPGSNMDAWMNVNGVPDYMRSYFWQYAISKATITGSSGGEVSMAQIAEVRGTDLAFERLRTNTSAARRELTMTTRDGFSGNNATSLYESYGTREGADRKFNEMLNQFDRLMGNLSGGVAGQLVGRVPSPIANLWMEGSSTLATMTGQVADALWPGDTPGNYGAFGGTSTSNMDPSFGRKVDAMMTANPRLQITSGFRAGDLQAKLHSQGVGMVAPQGQSMHSKGLAADLGPSSEFGWIVANASKFGLESGVGHGEPWHVGAPGTIGMAPIGDIGSIASGAWNAISDPGGAIGSAISGLSKLNPLSGIMGMLSPLTGMISMAGNLFSAGSKALTGDFSGLFGSGGLFDPVGMMTSIGGGLFDLMGLPDILNPAKAGELDFNDPNTLGSSVAFLTGSNNKDGTLNPRLSSATDWSKGPDAVPTSSGAGQPAAGGAYSGGSTGPANLQSIFDKYNRGVSVGGADISNPAGALEALTAAATAGFRGDELIAVAAIAGRESTWNHDAHRSRHLPNWPNQSTAARGDRGMWQMNETHDDALAAAGIISSNSAAGRRELFNIDVNARAAYNRSGGGDPAAINQLWGAGSGGWQIGGIPLHNAAQYVEPIYHMAKEHGFIGDPRFGGNIGATTMSAQSSSAPVYISNKFDVHSTGGEVDVRRLAAVSTDLMMQRMQDNSRGR